MTFVNVSEAHDEFRFSSAFLAEPHASAPPADLGSGADRAGSRAHGADAGPIARWEAARQWEGSFPPPGLTTADPEAAAQLTERGFVPLPVRAGDLLVFAGTLDHLSLPNASPHARHTYQLHIVEGPDAGVSWAEENWLQLADGRHFPRLVG